VTEDAPELPPFCRPCGFRHVGGAWSHAYRTVSDLASAVVELENIRRLCERHGVAEADGNGELRSTVAMVEEALIARPATGPTPRRTT
jgi:hypothetical protein